MKYSIIIPIYNVENYIEKCLYSVKYQTIHDWECICVNDGSDDLSSNIVEDIILSCGRMSRYIVIHRHNGGVSAARNTALDLSSGKWIQFLDADDSLDTNFLELVDNYMKLYPNVDSYEHTAIYCYQDEKRIVGDKGRIPQEQIVDADNILSDPYGIEYTNLARCVWNKIISRTKIETNHLRFYEGIPLSEDMLFAMQYYTIANKIAICPKIMGYLRVLRNDSTINTITYDKLITQAKVAEVIYHTCLNNKSKGTIKIAVASILNLAFLGKNFSIRTRKMCIEFISKNHFFNTIGIPFVIKYGNTFKARIFAILYYLSPCFIQKYFLRLL